MNVEQAAKQVSARFGVDAGAAKNLLTFFCRKINEHSSQGIDFSAMSDVAKGEYLRAGVTAWNTQSQAFFSELLANETEDAQRWRADIAGRVYDDIKACQAK